MPDQIYKLQLHRTRHLLGFNNHGAAAGQLAVKERIKAITLAPVEDFRRDSGKP